MIPFEAIGAGLYTLLIAFAIWLVYDLRKDVQKLKKR